MPHPRCFGFWLVFAAQVTLTATSSSISFDAPRDYVAGATSVAVGDFNRDGKQDVIAAGRTIRILLGNGDATLQPAVDVASGRAAYVAMVTGDFNGDGYSDVAAAMYDSIGEVAILLGNGDGSFGPAVSYLVGSSPLAIILADFNGDLIPDLATPDSVSGSVSMLFGNGDGTFHPAISVDVGEPSTSLAVGDFNGDSNADLAVAHPWSQQFSIVLGRGDGTFQPATTFATDYPAHATAVLDFNADSKPDLILIASRGQDVSYYFGNGDGTFAFAARGYAVNDKPRSLIAADFDGDSQADIAVTIEPFGYGDPSPVLVDLSKDGLGPPLSSNVRVKPYAMAAADFDGDSKMDLVLGGVDFSIVGIVRGTGDGLFVAAPLAAGGDDSVYTSSIGTGDFNNDGKQDLGAAQGVLLGNGDGTFQPRIPYPNGLAGGVLGTGDFNADLKADLIDQGVRVLLGNGDGTFTVGSTMVTGVRPSFTAIADFDGDSILDVAVCNRGLALGSTTYSRGSIAVLLGRGDGSFREPTQLTDVYFPQRVMTGDFNGDLRPDLAVANGGSEGGQQFLSVFLNSGGGSFRTVVLPTVWFPRSLIAGDFDQDGRSDLAVLVGSTIDEACRPVVLILLGLSDGTFRISDTFQRVGTCSYGHPIAADFDGDLDLDLAVPSEAGLLEIFAGNGDGTFERDAMFNATGIAYFQSLEHAIAADFNGDSKPDIAHLGVAPSRRQVIHLMTNTTPSP